MAIINLTKTKNWIVISGAIIIAIIITSLILINSPGRNPNAFCTTKKGCVTGLYCDTICIETSSCLPFGTCDFEFCPLGPPSAEQGKRYRCNDGTYGCVILKGFGHHYLTGECADQPSYTCLGGKCLSHYDTRASEIISIREVGECKDIYMYRDCNCVIDDPSYIQSGECHYI